MSSLFHHPITYRSSAGDFSPSCFAPLDCFVFVNVDKNGWRQELGRCFNLQHRHKASLKNQCHIQRTAFLYSIYSAGGFSSLKRCKRRSHLSGKRGDVKKTEGLRAEKMNLFYPAKQTLAVY